MIEKERLEELIEQGATIWHNDWEEIKLDKETCGIYECRSMNGEHISWCLWFSYDYNDEKHWEVIDILELEEDVEKGKWGLEFGCIERTERLELPTWEEFLKLEKIHSFKSKNNQIVVLFRNGNTIYLEDENWNILRAPLTKENYTLACRKCKELFLGESNVKD